MVPPLGKAQGVGSKSTHHWLPESRRPRELLLMCKPPAEGLWAHPGGTLNPSSGSCLPEQALLVPPHMLKSCLGVGRGRGGVLLLTVPLRFFNLPLVEVFRGMFNFQSNSQVSRKCVLTNANP
jgi:hypothetical protein